jgi:RNA polymerase sigma-70 factor (ECF subfamily)
VTSAGRRDDIERRLEQHRAALTAHCRRMLGSAFEADDAVQETMVRAWRGYHRFEGRSSLKSWLHRIATNVCFDMLNAQQRRARPTDPALWAMSALAVGAGGPEPVVVAAATAGAGAGAPAATSADPAERAVGREDVRLAFVAALLHLPPRQRSVLLLCEVLRWRAAEVAELLDTSVASVNSALQRARATLSELHGHDPRPAGSPTLDDDQRTLLHRYTEAFERYDVTALIALLR